MDILKLLLLFVVPFIPIAIGMACTLAVMICVAIARIIWREVKTML